ncbi:unnamed protein product [Sphagnum balticum]
MPMRTWQVPNPSLSTLSEAALWKKRGFRHSGGRAVELHTGGGRLERGWVADWRSHWRLERGLVTDWRGRWRLDRGWFADVRGVRAMRTTLGCDHDRNRKVVPAHVELVRRTSYKHADGENIVAEKDEEAARRTYNSQLTEDTISPVAVRSLVSRLERDRVVEKRSRELQRQAQRSGCCLKG